MPLYTKRAYPPERIEGWQFIWKDLDLEALGVTFVRLRAHEGARFTHSHEKHEEVYYVLEGEPALQIDGDRVALRRGDIVRVSAAARRAVGNPSERDACLLMFGGMPHATPLKAGRPSRIGDGIRYEDDTVVW